MTAQLRQLWSSRPARERRVLAGLAVFVAVAACLALMSAALAAREPLQRQVQDLRALSAGMDRQARELEQLRRLPEPAPPGGTLLERVQSALDARLSAAGPTRLETPDARHVVVVFEAVSFRAWLGWLEDLASRQVRLESCRIEALPAAGQASISVTLVQSGPP